MVFRKLKKNESQCGPMQLQAVEEALMSGFGCASLYNMLEKGEEAAPLLSSLCQKVLQVMSKNEGDMKELEEHPWAEVRCVYEACIRIRKFCQAILHLLNLSSMSGEDSSTAITKVLWFSQYSGKLVFERSVRQSITMQGSYYHELLQDVLKTAATTKTLEPKLASLRAILSQDRPFDLESLVNAAALFKELRAGMRRGSLDDDDVRMLAKLQLLGDAILSQKNVVASTPLIKALTKALEFYQENVPGVLDMVENIQKYMTENKAMLVSNELENSLKEISNNRVFDAKSASLLAELLQQCDRAQLTQSLINEFDAYLVEIFAIISAQASWD